MTLSTLNTQQGSPKGKHKPQRGQHNASKSSSLGNLFLKRKESENRTNRKKGAEELMTPDVLLLMTAASVVQNQQTKGNANKKDKTNQQRQNYPGTDSIPTKESTTDILALLSRNDNASRIQSSPPRNINQSLSSNRPSSPPTRDTTSINNRPRRNSPVPSTSPSNCQRWAGASYANSPAPSQLPKPVFGSLMDSNASSAVRQLDFSEVEIPHQQETQQFYPQYLPIPQPNIQSIPVHHNPYPQPPHQHIPFHHHQGPHPQFYNQPYSIPQPFVDPVFHQSDNAHLSNHLKLMLNIGSN